LAIIVLPLELCKFIKDIRKRADVGRLIIIRYARYCTTNLLTKSRAISIPCLVILVLFSFHCHGVIKPGSSRLFQTQKAGPTQALNEHVLPVKMRLLQFYINFI